MTLEATGVLDFSWAAPSVTFEQLAVDVHKNNNFLERTFQTNNSIRVSGLIEGDSAFVRVTPTYFGAFYTGSQIITPSQSISVTNFHLSGKKVTISNVELNGEEINSQQTISGINATGLYYSQNSEVSFGLINPRDNSNIVFARQEPFYSGLRFHAISGSTELSTGFADANSFIFENSYGSRDIKLKCVAEDIYGSGTTGNITLENEPISILSANVSFEETLSEGYGTINILPEYSIAATGVEYVIYEDESYTSYITSGISPQTSLITDPYPVDTSGFLKLTPFDWFGSGHQFSKASPIFLSSASFLSLSDIVNDRFLDSPTGTNIIFDVNENNTSGYYAQISIDSSANSSFDSDSYFTGQVDRNVQVFDTFTNRTGEHENFYYTINLYQSGTNLLQDEAAGSFYSPRPRIVNTSIDFNYEDGLTTLSFNSEPSLSYTGVNLLYSGDGFSDFVQLTEPSFQSGSINVSGTVKLERSFDNHALDTVGISGSGSRPSILLDTIPFPSIESSVNILLKNTSASSYIDRVSVFRKPSLSLLSGTHPDYISGVLNFTDYESHFFEESVIGHYIDLPPQGIARNQNYVVTGMAYTGSYELAPVTGYYQSGRHFSYRFTPIDGYGSGSASDPLTAAFASNAIADSVDEGLQTAEGNITTSQTEIHQLQTGVVYLSGFQRISGEKTFNLANVTGQLTVGDPASGIAMEVSDRGLEVATNAYFSGSLDVGDSSTEPLLEVSPSRLNINTNLYVTGDVQVTGTFLYNNMPPQSSSSYGKSGQMAFDHAYLYACTGSNSWARVEFTDTSW
jgi:hypothetical protein